MLAIRLYLCVLTLGFLFLVAFNRGVGVLEAIVIICSVLYLILDARTDLQAVRADIQALEHLERRLSLLLR